MKCPACKGLGYTGESETPSGGIIRFGCLACGAKGKVEEEHEEKTKCGKNQECCGSTSCG